MLFRSGEYELGGMKVIVKDRKAALSNGTIAGSTTDVFEEVKKVIEIGIDKEQAILSATYIAAKAIGKDHEIGDIAVGKMADLIVVSKDFDLEQVFIGGKGMSR